MDAAHIKEASETQQMLSPDNYLDKPAQIHAAWEALGGVLHTPRIRRTIKTGERLVMHFATVDPCYNAGSIRRFQKEMWRDGKGSGYICYYERFDV